MPESVQDRCTKSHEYIFLLSKNARYYYDGDAISEQSTWDDGGRVKPAKFGGANKHEGYGTRLHSGNDYIAADHPTRNRRSVWTVTTKPLKESHFAAFPEDLIEPMVKAGCPVGGIVLDPFFGSGTTGRVARRLQRNYIGIELNPKYCTEIASKRTTNIQQEMFI